ncbi:DUF6701 domain-containing protein [Alteromonas sp. H39]|uniref:DUF6701 domain-containing protein n=1 Tax=Alteromonas sp. H39 TaxID=3389876 RepID=UPI0039E14C6E
MKYCLALLLSVMALPALAAQCTAVFADAAGSYSSSSSIRFQPGASLWNTDGIIDFNDKTDNAGVNTSCATSSCRLSGQTAAAVTLPAFQNANSTQDVLVKQSQLNTLTPGDYDEVRLETYAQLETQGAGVYRIRRLQVGGNSQVRLAGGVYWIDELTTDNFVTFAPVSGEKVTVFVNRIQTSTQTQFNTLAAEPSDMTIFSYGDVNISQNNVIYAFIYTSGRLSLGNSAILYGAVNAGSVVMNDFAQIHYRPASIVNIEAENLCSVPVVLPDPIGRWPINVCSLSGSNTSVPDSIAGNNGEAVESPSSYDNGRLCQAAYFRGVGDIISIPHSPSYLLASGTVSFWVNTNNFAYYNRASAGGMAVFSKDSYGLDNGGHLTIWVTETGGVRVLHQNTLTSAQINTGPVLTEGQWHHIAYTFGTGGMELFVDGVLQGANSSFTDGLLNNAEPIVLGGNAWLTGNGTSESDELVDLYQGSVDDLRIYADALSAEQINLITGETASTCTTCTTNPTLMSHWKMDVCSVNGTPGEIVDAIRGYNGRAVNGVSALRNARFCQGMTLQGEGQHLLIDHRSAMALSEGTLSLWFKASDLQHAFRASRGAMSVFSKDAANSNSSLSGLGHFSFYIQDDGSLLFTQKNSNTALTLYSESGLATEREWHHVTYSWDAQQVRIHFDGAYLGGVSGNFGWRENSEPIVVGANTEYTASGSAAYSQLTDFFKGEIDDIRLYSDALTTADVQALFTASEYHCVQCEGGDPKLLYRFEEPAWSEAGAVTDSSGNDQHGSALGRAAPQLPGNKISCRVADIPSNTTANEIDAVETHLNINEVGERGTVSFWYKSNASWQGGGQRQLFDASKIQSPSSPDGRYDKFFFMSLNNSGQLTFGMEDNYDYDLLAATDPLNYGANEWVHIAISWDLAGEDVDLYINGARVYMQGQVTLISSTFGQLGSLRLGDNATSYLVNGSVPNAANGQFDDLRVYDYELTREEIRDDIADVLDCNVVHHYEITHPSQALTCDAAEVTLRACANAACTQLVSDTTTVALSAGNWMPSQVISFRGETQLSLVQRNTGVHTVTVSGQDAGSLPASANVCTQGCEINFVDAGFTFFDAASADDSTTLPDIVAQDSLARIGLRAVKDNAGVCEALVSGEQDITLTFDCVQTGADYSPNQCRVPFAGIGITGDGSGDNSGTLTLTFDDQGRTTFDGLHYSDAGRLSLRAGATIDGATITSGSTTLDSIPAALVLTTDDTDVYPAGQEFSLTIHAEGSQGAMLPGYSPGNLQAMFQRLIPNDISAADGQWKLGDAARISSSTSASFTDIAVGAFTAGEYQYAESYVEEVGSFEADIRDSQYLGNNTIDAIAKTLGRFTPAYFDVTASATPALENTCGVFTYVGQQMAFEAGREPVYNVVAYNGKGQITRNYGKAQWRLNRNANDYTSAVSVADESDYTGTLELSAGASSVVVSGQDDYDGSAELTVMGMGLTYSKIPAVNSASGMGSPFSAQAALDVAANFFTDSDGVCFQSTYPGACETMAITGIAGATQRYGRLRLENTFGPETEPLRVVAVTEYFDSGSWQRNLDDNCTVLDIQESANDIVLTDASSGAQETDITDLLNDVEANGTFQQGVSDSSDLIIGPPLNAQGQGVRGVVMMSLAADAGAAWAQYLNIDWNLDGVIDQNDTPNASVAFGLYRGNDRTLNWRERF